MRICGFEKTSLVDFDKYICSTIFLAGCNFKCPFCHNGGLVIHAKEETEISLEEVLEYLRKRHGIVEAVCVSGGEPTLNKDLDSLLMTLKEMGLLVKLDTNGTNPKMIKDLINRGLVDYIAMDIKSSLDSYHEITCSNTDLDVIKESINILMTSGIKYEFRTTLVKEIHTLEDIKKMGELIKGADRLFLQHYKETEGVIKNIYSEVKYDEALKYQEILSSYVKEVNLRGYN